MNHGFLVGLFDVLGFEQKLRAIGLAEMRARYEALIAAVDYRKEQIRHVFGELKFKEAPYWTADGDISIFNEIHGAYASDSILVWANRTWPQARSIDAREIEALAKSASNQWVVSPIPCDNFLDVCSDLICRGLEVGLPLRGAVAMGDAVLEGGSNMFLGIPLVDVARLERSQRYIGSGMCKSFLDQTIPKRFVLQFDTHLKDHVPEQWSGQVLDWPRHWRHTRSDDLRRVIRSLNIDADHAKYYENTIALMDYSKSMADRFESPAETSIRSVFEEFSWSNEELSVRARAVRRVPIDNSEL